MEALKLKALAALRWVWETLVSSGKYVWEKLRVTFDTIYDPPPRTIRFFFWSATGILVSVWLTFAFVNSWFYKPTAAYFASWVGDDSYMLPEIEPLPSVPTPTTPVPSVEVVCQDMSDTPHCVPVYESGEKRSQGTQNEAKINPLPAAKPQLSNLSKKEDNAGPGKVKAETFPKAKAKERLKSPVGYKARKSPAGDKRRAAVKYEPYWPF